MAAQAIGRATVLRDAASLAVGIGAVLFMLSDGLLAINRFAQPLPMAQFWVLATYYAAQILIVRNARAPLGGARPPPPPTPPRGGVLWGGGGGRARPRPPAATPQPSNKPPSGWG